MDRDTRIEIWKWTEGKGQRERDRGTGTEGQGWKDRNRGTVTLRKGQRNMDSDSGTWTSSGTERQGLIQGLGQETVTGTN